MTTHLLDSDAVIDMLNSIGRTIDFVRGLRATGGSLATCDIVLTEVASGLAPDELIRARSLLGSLVYLDTTREAALQAGVWRYTFRRRGVVLGIPDAVVAAVAVYHGTTLVTGNYSHYPMAEVQLIRLPRGALP